MIKTVEDLMHDVEVAIEETVADRSGDGDFAVTADEIAADMAEAVAWDAPVEVAREFFWMYLGYVPSTYAKVTGTPHTDFLDE
jgi:hypothetical protein